MRLSKLGVALVLALGLVLVGCKGKDEDKKEEAKAGEKKADEKKADDKKADEKKDEPTAEDKKDKAEAVVKKDKPAADTPVATGDLDAKGTVLAALKAAQAKDVKALLALFPPKYVKDIEGVVQDFAKNMDTELFAKAVAIGDKAFAIAAKHKDALAQMVIGFGAPVPADDVKKAIDTTVEVWGMLKGMGLTDLEKLKTFDLAAFAGNDLPKVVDKLWKLAEESPQKAQIMAAMAVLSTAQVEVVETQKDEKWGEIVKLEINIAGEKEIGKLVKVDGKWIPKEMAEEWDEGMKEAHEGIKEMAAELPKVRTEAMAQMVQVETMLDQVEKSGDLSALAALGGMMGMPGGGMAPPKIEAPKVEAPKGAAPPAMAPAGKEEKKEEKK